MNLQQLKEIINKIINEYKNKFINKGIDSYRYKINHKIFKEINNKYKNLFKNISELIYLINNYNNLENLHIFCECGNKNNFININRGYCIHCSKKCTNDDKNIIEKRKQTFLKRYNGTSSFNSKELREKAKLTMLNDIDESGLNSIQRRNIKIKLSNLNNIDENGLNSYQRGARKMINTKLNDIDINGLNGIQRGVITKKNNIDENGLNTFQRSRIKQFKTMRNNIDENGLNGFQRSVIKNIQTKKKNNSFNKSIQEEQIYNYLLQKFNKDDIERQYKSKLYPFNCDFYIKTLDLYIEYHGTWTHGKKPFKNSIEDLEKLKELKNKNSKYYNTAIYVWSNLDVRKLNTFKNNKLNYKIFYNINQFNNWFNKIKI